MSPLAITTGEPAGIGPDIALHAALSATRPLRLLGDAGLLAARAGRLGLPWPLPAPIEIEHVPMAAPCTAGR
ncbi:MAG: 4-hydroxythreonine-4-phosphate dehydrogenase PdxA, partial [Betaproteobacteria bacterium]